MAVLLAACGGTSSAGGGALRTIQVSVQEYCLHPVAGTVATPGTYAVKVTNQGSVTHAFTVEASGGGDEVESGSISPGSSKTVKVTLDASKRYEMYCPVPGHKQQGMAGTISVGA